MKEVKYICDRCDKEYEQLHDFHKQGIIFNYVKTDWDQYPEGVPIYEPVESFKDKIEDELCHDCMNKAQNNYDRWMEKGQKKE